jgi:hypothetical protein
MVMSTVIPTPLRLRALAACALLAAAACGGGDEKADAAAPAQSADSATVPAPAAAAAPSTPAPAPAAQPDAPILDSAMTPQKAAEVAKAPVQGPVNVDVLEDFELTMPRVRQMIRASQNLAQLQERRPELRDSMTIRTMDPNLLYQRINSIPEARDAVAQAGLTPQGYATATAALLQGIMVLEMEKAGRKPPPGIQYNEENVDFVAEHIQEIMQLMQEAGARMPQGQPPRS